MLFLIPILDMSYKERPYSRIILLGIWNMHELFHCKEISITSSYIDYNKLYFKEQFVTTRELLFDTAVQQWGEYYAHKYFWYKEERSIYSNSFWYFLFLVEL